MSVKLSRYHVAAPPVVDEISGKLKRIVFATRTSTVRVIDEIGWEIIQSGNFNLLPTEMLLELVDIELLVPDEEDELKIMLDRNNAAALDSDLLYMVVQPTAACQLGCDYCGQVHTKQRLSDEDQQLFIARVKTKLEMGQFKRLEVAWFGSEPLSGLAVIRKMTPHLKLLAQANNCTYTAKIVTNGVLLSQAIAHELVHELNIDFIEITLDGIGAYHDARRHYKSGQKTFERIYNNVVALAQDPAIDCKLTVRCNVDYRNFEGVSPLLRLLAAEGIQKRISFYVAPIHSWGNDAHTRSMSKEEFAEWEIKWFAEMIELGYEPRLVPPRKEVVCLAVMPQAELVDAYGQLFNCTEVSYVPTYGDPNEFSIGSTVDGVMAEKRKKLGDFNEKVKEEEYWCHSCRMLPVCGGSCPKLWLEGIPPCPSPKTNIESRLLLEYARTRINNMQNV